MSDLTMPAQLSSTSTLADFEAALLRLADSPEPRGHDPLDDVPPEVLAWVALAPAWPLRWLGAVARKVIDTDPNIPPTLVDWLQPVLGLSSDPAVLVEQVVASGLSTYFGGPLVGIAAKLGTNQFGSGEAPAGDQQPPRPLPRAVTWMIESGVCQARLAPRGPELWMNEGQRNAVRRYLARQPEHGVSWIGHILAQVAGSFVELSRGESQEMAVERWLQFARLGSDFTAMAALIDERVRAAISEAEAPGLTSAPEALRWIELARAFVPWFGAPIEAAAVSASRKLELFHRRANDARLLKNYFTRPAQDQALLDLLKLPDSDESSAVWALHYVGLGGMGKTMFVRHLVCDLAPDLKLAVGRIDFDHLHPDYPTRAPALFLMSLAEELGVHVDGNKEGFAQFELEARNLHAQIAASPRPEFSGDEGLLHHPAFMRLLELFYGALKEMAVRRRPLLILDTCEELAKLRDGRLPNSVLVTFALLEAIHQRVPAVRVVFSGRRPLAASGDGWEFRGKTDLFPRPFLRLHEILGFSRQEGRAFVESYHRPVQAMSEPGEASRHEETLTGRVDPALVEPILRQSVVSDRNSVSPFQVKGRAAGAEEERFTPYDLDMYASWSCEHPGLREEDIQQGAHFYVRERIVGRILDARLRDFLPVVAVLGRFDREIVRLLLPVPAESFTEIFDDLVRQEWITLDHAASAQGSVWAVETNLRRRLLAYAQEREPAAWQDACRRVAEVLGRVTVERPWSDLIPAYFDAVLRALPPDSPRAAEWWETVERRLAEDGRWDSAQKITGALLAEDGAAAAVDDLERPRGSKAAEHPLRAAILATHACTQMHLAPAGTPLEAGAAEGGTAGVRYSLPELWREVLQKCERHPVPDGAAQLEYRARCGLLAGWPQTVPDAEWPDKLAAALDALPKELPDDSQSLAATVGALEGAVEAIEYILEEWGYGPWKDPARKATVLLKALRERLAANIEIREAGSDLVTFATALQARLAAEENPYSTRPGLEPFLAAITSGNLGRWAGQQRWLGWRRPDDLAARVKLELLRVCEFDRDMREKALDLLEKEIVEPETIDGDRLASAILAARGCTQVPERGEEVGKAISRSLKLAGVAPQCNAHRHFQPCFAALLEAHAEAGEPNKAFTEMADIRRWAERKQKLEIVQAIDRVAVQLGVQTYAVEDPSFDFGDSLRESTELVDLELGVQWAEMVPSLVQETILRLEGAAKASGLHESRVIQLRSLLSPLKFGLMPPAQFPRNADRLATELRRSYLTDSQQTADTERISKLAHEIGERKAARIAVREVRRATFGKHTTGALLCARWAATWYGAGDDQLGAALNGLVRSLLTTFPVAGYPSLPLNEKDREILSKIVETRQQIQRMADPKFTTPITAIFEQDEARMKYWGPLYVRLQMCRFLQRSGPPNDEAQTQIEIALKSHYARRRGAVLPVDLAVLLTKQNSSQTDSVVQPVLVANGLNSSTSKLKTASMAVLGWGIIGLLGWGWISGVNWVSVKLFEATPPWYGHIAIILFLILVIAGRNQFSRFVLRAMLLSSRLSIQIRPTELLADPNRPLLASNNAQIRWVSGFGFWRNIQRRLTRIEDADYRAMPRIASLFKQGLSLGVLAPDEPVLQVRLAVDPLVAAAPWEAGIQLVAELRPLRQNPLLVRRIQLESAAAKLEPLSGLQTILSLTGDPHLDERATRGWDAVKESRKFMHQCAKQDSRLREPERVAVLHLVGRVISLQGGVRFSLGTGTRLDKLFSAADLISQYRNLRLCIVQGLPFEDQAAELRRASAAQARRLAAELFVGGATAVLVIPSLPSTIFDRIIPLLAAEIDQPRSVTAWMRLVRKVQEEIAEIATVSDPLPEAAYDVCLYMQDDFDLRVVLPTQQLAA